jgi:hypothetical protein
MPKSVAGHVARAAVSTGRATTSVVKGVHSELPIPQAPSWGGYWNWVSATVILAFVLYTAQKGTLGTWVSFFGWNPQPAPTTTSAASTTGQTSTAANPNVGTVVGAGVAGSSGLNLNNPFAGIPGLGQEFQSLLPGNSNGAATQSTPGQANPIPGLSGIGAWLKSITGVGQ